MKRRAIHLFILCTGAWASVAGGVRADPPDAAPPTVIRPKFDGPNTSNLMPRTRVKIDPPIRNPVIRTHSFPIGVHYGGGSCPLYVNPYLFHSGRGHYVQYGYPYPLDLSFHNLQPGQTVTIPAPTYWRTQYEGLPLREEQRRVDPASAGQPATVAAPPPAPPAPAIDEGREAFLARDYERAIAIYERRHREQLAIEESMLTGQMVDRAALRLLAFAYAGAGDAAHAADLLERAQSQDASLATRRVQWPGLFESRRELRRLVNDAVKHAKKLPSRSSWELVAVLMETEGRDEVAAKMRARVAAPAPTSSKPPVRAPGPATYSMPPVPGP